MLSGTALISVRNAAAGLLLTLALSAGAGAQNWYAYDRDDYRYDRSLDDRGSRSAAQAIGFEDGSTVARQDLYRGKPYNPYPRGPYAHSDHGYQRDYGDKYLYKQEYASAYLRGYERAFRR